MKQMIKNVTTFLAFTAVLCMHIYFVLLLIAKPALAEETKETVTIEAQVEETANKKAAITDEDKNFDFNLNGTQGTVKVSEKGITITSNGDGKTVEKTVMNYPSMVQSSLNAIEDIVVPIVLFLCAFGFAGYTVYAKSRTRREYLETIKALAQSGQPISQELLNTMNATVNGGKLLNSTATKYDANAVQGIKYIFLGVGFCGFMMLISDGHVAAAVGFLFIVMGAFHIYTSQMIQKQKPNEAVATSTPEIK